MTADSGDAMDHQKIDGVNGSRNHALMGEFPGLSGSSPRLVTAVKVTVGVRDHLRG